jgi:hypothetical protein
MLDRPASDMVLERIARTGVKVSTETEIVGIVGRVGAVVGVVTSSHKMIPCQLVIACTGTTPETSLANSCDVPLTHKHGILVDDALRTSVRDIYAAGDAAALKNPLTGGYAPRAQWYAAVLQARVVAARMTGHEQDTAPFGVPWHATHVGELSFLTVGNPLGWVEGAATLTDSTKGSYRRLSLWNDRLIGYLSLGPAQPDGLAIKRLIDEGHSVREIKKALLKGEFDAREYFSRQRFSATHTMVTTGKLVASDFDRRAMADMQTPRRHTDTLSHGTIDRAISRFIPNENTYKEDEMSPFTGNLPVPTTDPVAVPSKEIIETTLVSLPARKSRRDGSTGLLSSVGAVPCACPEVPAIVRRRETEEAR